MAKKHQNIKAYIKDRGTQRGWKQKSGQSWAHEIEQNGYDVFGTLNFNSSKHITSEHAQALIGTYWHKVDRTLFGRAADKGFGVERYVFVEHGALGDNMHTHFIAHSTIPIQQFCMALNVLWSRLSNATASMQRNAITPIVSAVSVGRYVSKDFANFRADTLGLSCSHKNAPGTDLRSFNNAEQAARLARQVTPMWQKQAKIAYAKHLASNPALLSHSQQTTELQGIQ